MMLQTQGKRIMIFLLLVVYLLIIVLAAGMAFGEQGISDNLEEKFAELSDEEKKVLEKLFDLAQSIEKMAAEAGDIAASIEEIETQIRALRKDITAEEAQYQKRQRALEEVLKSYQRTGPSSYLERLLDSSSLVVFLRRLATLQDFTRNTGELLGLLQSSKDKLIAQGMALENKIALLEETQERLAESILQSQKLQEENERYLASLKDERNYYQKQLATIQSSWGELIRFFPEVSKKFSRIIKEEELPADAMQLVFTANGIKAVVKDAAINQIIADHGLSDMVFAFSTDRVEISIPKKRLMLSGIFVLNGQILTFEPQEGSYYGMVLKKSNLDELFSKEKLQLDLTSMAEGNHVRSVKVSAGQLELMINPVFR